MLRTPLTCEPVSDHKTRFCNWRDMLSTWKLARNQPILRPYECHFQLELQSIWWIVLVADIYKNKTQKTHVFPFILLFFFCHTYKLKWTRLFPMSCWIFWYTENHWSSDRACVSKNGVSFICFKWMKIFELKSNDDYCAKLNNEDSIKTIRLY